MIFKKVHRYMIQADNSSIYYCGNNPNTWITTNKNKATVSITKSYINKVCRLLNSNYPNMKWKVIQID